MALAPGTRRCDGAVRRTEARVGLSRDLLGEVRRLDQYDLRRLMIVVRGLLVHADGPPGAGDPEPTLPNVTYRQEEVRCGKPNCTACPHGPYWYGYWKEDGRTRKQYIGRHLPGEPLEPVVPDLSSPGADASG